MAFMEISGNITFKISWRRILSCEGNGIPTEDDDTIDLQRKFIGKIICCINENNGSL